MRQQHNKLVRDLIPEIITASGSKYETKTLDLDSYRKALLDKLVEEAEEARDASQSDNSDSAHLLTELADLCEVFDAILGALNIDHDAVLAEQMKRRIERGAFDNRILLLWTE